MSGYPVQSSKIQRPPLRDETLARDRLLDWLHAKIHHRIVYVIAEAGYGKTTLLADFSRRTRHRTLWYRLDSDDGHWLAFLSHLVAAGREQDPDFAPVTSSLLREVATGGPSFEGVLESFLRELAAMSAGGAVVILDDFHLVDEAADIREIMRELVARAPERITFVIASRRTPSLPVARLRGQGEVAELGTDDLRFNPAETEQLFRETYGRPLEPDVLTDLSRRTEGWAASLQLVQAAIRGRTAGEVRSFVRSLSGAEGELYDYLAEEVIGTLPEELQLFLLKIALLPDVDAGSAQVVTALPQEAVAQYLLQGERAGLIVRSHGAGRARRTFHPLVQQFLEQRAAREFGDAGVAELHRRAANTVGVAWDAACFHYARAGDYAEVHRTIRGSVVDILGRGDVALAAKYLRELPELPTSAEAAMVLSRYELQCGRPDSAAQLAEEAYRRDPSPLTGTNLGSVMTLTGNLERASKLAETIRGGGAPVLDDIALAIGELVRLSVDGDLGAFVDHVLDMAERQRALGYVHYAGVSLLNGALALRAQGDAARCIELAGAAQAALTESAAPAELVSARLVLDWASTHLGLPRESLDVVALLEPLDADLRAEAISEAAATEVWYGEAASAKTLLQTVEPGAVRREDIRQLLHLVTAELATRDGDYSVAGQALTRIGLGLTPEPAHRVHQLAVRAWYSTRVGKLDSELVAEARGLAARQQAHFWTAYLDLLEAIGNASASGAFSLPSRVLRETAYLSVLAEGVCDFLALLPEEHLEAVALEAGRRPDRWRVPLRQVVRDASSPSRWEAARLLDRVGASADVSLLRAVAKTARAGTPERAIGKVLARRVAPRVFVEDQGRVAVVVGERRIEGHALRRKVLALLCFLLTRNGFAATRDEALDALWPELEPEVSINSLNQTVYFLRRVFEPDYAESTSPGFVHFDSNVLWLDGELVTSRSQHCARLISDAEGGDSGEPVERLADQYVGRFALDFAYEEWAIPFREALHAAYLQVIEAAIAADIAAGRFERGIRLARAALGVDRLAEGLEISLVRLYRLSGAHAAAHEQYAHYAALLRDELGIEPPPLEAV